MLAYRSRCPDSTFADRMQIESQVGDQDLIERPESCLPTTRDSPCPTMPYHSSHLVRGTDVKTAYPTAQPMDSTCASPACRPITSEYGGFPARSCLACLVRNPLLAVLPTTTVGSRVDSAIEPVAGKSALLERASGTLSWQAWSERRSQRREKFHPRSLMAHASQR